VAGNGLISGLGGLVTTGRILGAALGLTGQASIGTTTTSTTSTLTVQALSNAAPAGLNLLAYGTGTGTTASTSQLRFSDQTGKYVGFQAPGVVSTSTVWQLPGADGLANQILVTNGQGILSWGSAAVAAGNNQIQFTNNGGSQSATSTFSFSDNSALNPYGTLILATTSTSSLVTGTGLATNAIYAGGNVKIGARVVNGTAVGSALVIDSATTSWATTTNALYNNNGILYWNGVAISGNATGTSFMPVFYNESSRNGQAGLAFIYKSQIYVFGYGTTGTYSPYGQEGVNTTSPKLVPVVNPPTGWNEIAAAPTSICALSNVGTVYCWGLGTTGQTGNGTNATNYTAIPISFPAPASSIVKIFTSTDSIYTPGGGTNSFFAIDSTGRVYGWGYNTQGQLGNGNNTAQSSPIQIIPAAWSGKTITKIALSPTNGATFAAAIDSTGQL
jgi:hypothetical protein